MKVTFFTAVVNVKVSSIPAGQDQISDGLYITTDNETLERFLQGIETTLGHLETSFLRDASAIIYSVVDIDGAFDWFTYLNKRLAAVKAFFNTMWLVKDNAANCELGFLTYEVPSEIKVHSNTLFASYSLADGSLTSVDFSREELRQARSIYRKLIGNVEFTKTDSPGIITSPGVARFMRGMYWVSVARSADIGERLASYCTALESLFATTSAELTHRLSERIAVFVGKSYEERIQIYREVKKAYGYRSVVVHGDVMKPSKAQDLISCAKYTDELLRRIFWQALSDEKARTELAGSNEELDNYFLELLFSNC